MILFYSKCCIFLLLSGWIGGGGGGGVLQPLVFSFVVSEQKFSQRLRYTGK
jgi:hypothetical protein